MWPAALLMLDKYTKRGLSTTDDGSALQRRTAVRTKLKVLLNNITFQDNFTGGLMQR